MGLLAWTDTGINFCKGVPISTEPLSEYWQSGAVVVAIRQQSNLRVHRFNSLTVTGIKVGQDVTTTTEPLSQIKPRDENGSSIQS